MTDEVAPAAGATIVSVPVTAFAPSGATRTSRVCPAPWIGDQPPIALRVSSIRVGGTGTNDNPPTPNVPVRSTMTSADVLVSTQIVSCADVATNAEPATASIGP